MGRRALSHGGIRRLAWVGCALRNGERACAELACSGAANRGLSTASAALRHLADSSPASVAVSQKGGFCAGGACVATETSAEICRRGEHLRLGPSSPGGSDASPQHSAPRPVEGQKRVRFDLDKNTYHTVRPYAEVYGFHPREFVFERGGYIVTPICKPLDVHEAVDTEDTGSIDQDMDALDEGWILIG